MTSPQTPRQWHQRVWTLSWPVILANLAIPLVGAVDTAVMGRMPVSAYIGAVAVGATIFNAVYWMFGFLRMGTTGLTAQAFGANQSEELVSIAARAGAIAIALGLTLIALQLPLKMLALWIFTASEAVEQLAGDYYSVRVWGAPALMLHMVALGVLFGLQRMRAALVISLLLNLTNITLDLLFVLGFGWGVKGVAAATVASEWLAAGAGIAIVRQALRAHGWQGPWPDELLATDRLKALFNVSINLVIRSFFVQLPFFAFTVLAASLGDLVLAANAVLMQFFFIMAYGLDGTAHTAETLAGHAYGARDRPRLRLATRYTLIWSGGFAAAASLCYALFGGTLIDLLTALPDVQQTARAYLPWAAAAPLVAVWAFLFDGIFIGTTHITVLRNAMFVAVLAYGAVVWLTLDRWGNHGLWFSMMVFLGLRGLLLAWQYPALERSAERPVASAATPDAAPAA